MKKKQFLRNSWQGYLPMPAFFLTLLVAGCQADDQTVNLPVTEDFPKETIEEYPSSYYSDTLPEECLICGDGKGTLLPLYRGQKNLGIINLNTFDLAPVTINRYDDFGELIEKPANGSSTHVTNTGEGGFFLSVSEDVNRGYAHGNLSFGHDEMLDLEKVANHLCSDCLNRMMENCWGDTPLGMGVIDFSTGEVRLFEENIFAFTFGDYYVSCRSKDSDEEDTKEISLLVFYCPERYQD